VYGKLLRKLRESKGRAQAEVARTVGISPAHLARLETNQRGLYLEDFVKIAEALGEKPGNLLPNDLGDIGYMKPLIDRLAAVDQDLFPRVSAIVDEIVRLTGSVSASTPPPARKSPPPKRKSPAPRSQKKRR
jgi:transcriptional regulator with XRE-family HTH domain